MALMIARRFSAICVRCGWFIFCRRVWLFLGEIFLRDSLSSSVFQCYKTFFALVILVSQASHLWVRPRLTFGWKVSSGTNTLAYLFKVLVTLEKLFYSVDTTSLWSLNIWLGIVYNSFKQKNVFVKKMLSEQSHGEWLLIKLTKNLR